MDKKILGIIIILTIIVGAFILVYETNYVHNSVKVGNTYFTLPYGYHEVNTNGHINITDGNTPMGLGVHEDSDIDKYIDKYIKLNEKKNVSVKIHEFKVNDVIIHKSLVENNTRVIHYWFINDGKVYEFYTWFGNSKTDEVVSDLIKSMRTFIF